MATAASSSSPSPLHYLQEVMAACQQRLAGELETVAAGSITLHLVEEVTAPLLYEGNYLPILQSCGCLSTRERFLFLQAHAGLHGPLLFEQAWSNAVLICQAALDPGRKQACLQETIFPLLIKAAYATQFLELFLEEQDPKTLADREASREQRFTESVDPEAGPGDPLERCIADPQGPLYHRMYLTYRLMLESLCSKHRLSNTFDAIEHLAPLYAQASMCELRDLLESAETPFLPGPVCTVEGRKEAIALMTSAQAVHAASLLKSFEDLLPRSSALPNSWHPRLVESLRSRLDRFAEGQLSRTAFFQKASRLLRGAHQGSLRLKEGAPINPPEDT